MNRKSFKIAKATVFILLASVLLLSSLRIPKVTAIVTLTINPTSGKVGTTIEIDATIETENGFYVVRWNNTLNITTGFADGTNVQTSFTVPQTAGAPEGRDITIELIDDTAKIKDQTTFKLYSGYYIEPITPQPPLQLQEGANTTIRINITGGESDTVYTANITVKDPANTTSTFLTTLNTTATGYGESYVSYPEDFGIKAHTNYTGRYTISFNETATSDFSIGLTNATQYAIFQTVNIRAANYTYPSEHAWVNITYGGEVIFSKNVSATNGMVETNWEIPSNAFIGTYTVTVTTSTTPGTRKPVDDTQQFTVEKPIFTVQINAESLSGEPLSGISVEAYIATVKVIANSTNATGAVTFQLVMANYTFKALWKDAEVGILSDQNIIEDKVGNKALTLRCQLTNIKILVIDEAKIPVPFVNLTLYYNYTTRLDTVKQETSTFVTSYTGIWELRSMFVNVSYIFEARRYGYIFNQTPIERMPIRPWFNMTVTLPTHTALIRVMDAQDKSAKDVKVKAYEWSKGIGQPDQSHTTDSDGNVTFSLPFGKYRIRAYDGDILLGETTINLIQNQSSFIFRLDTFNVELAVAVMDYFNQPIPNAVVKVEQKTTTESMEGITGSDGRVTFNITVGGVSKVSVSIRGGLGETKNLFLANSTQIMFKLNRYVVIVGYAVEISQFVTAIAAVLLIVAFIAALTYKRLLKAFRKGK